MTDENTPFEVDLFCRPGVGNWAPFSFSGWPLFLFPIGMRCIKKNRLALPACPPPFLELFPHPGSQLRDKRTGLLTFTSVESNLFPFFRVITRPPLFCSSSGRFSLVNRSLSSSLFWRFVNRGSILWSFLKPAGIFTSQSMF